MGSHLPRLLYDHYFFQKDIDICSTFNFTDEFHAHPNLSGIESLHEALREEYTKQEAATPIAEQTEEIASEAGENDDNPD